MNEKKDNTSARTRRNPGNKNRKPVNDAAGRGRGTNKNNTAGAKRTRKAEPNARGAAATKQATERKAPARPIKRKDRTTAMLTEPMLPE